MFVILIKSRKYQSRISGPLMDRIDIHVEVPALKFSELSALNDDSESSTGIRERVVKAREIQNARLLGSGIYANAQMAVKGNKKILHFRWQCF
ncbi:hypothetical protein AGMMS5026_07910 [Endomicrobiia bacterium]|nr:hypothetical protein AGMMS49523_03430 [Endomicrobiia bacterium]GHT12256.1 hypothetical protein AGMMS49571_03940 [Endomicrobiia bacterium]GHT20541.1 hypothetical protein AGMMS49929_07450 [Endomicrobiia bacterium]GHT25199.1 hypothetical protein AGMMS49953_09570 [Endomicrobiia bacterium]GHT26172.1 hypothetical protein AGMMS49995_02240 [Endomicrobiia bacterium]